VGFWHGGEAQRGAWGSRGGVACRGGRWPVGARGVRAATSTACLAAMGASWSGACSLPPRPLAMLDDVGWCGGARGHGGQGEE
jgi:hypothetical protein